MKTKSNKRPLYEMIRPIKRLGQHFIRSDFVLDKMVKVARIKPNDYILEVGPGTGALTRYLLRVEARVMAVEIDKRMVQILKKNFGNKKLTIIEDDILRIDESILPQNFSVVANLPYQITSPFIKKIISLKNPPKRITLLLQRDVAERICAPAGDSARGLLSILVRLFGKPSIVSFVPKDAFFPVPGVESAIISIKPRAIKIKSQKRDLIRVVQAGFSQKRKMIKNSIAAVFRIEPKTLETKFESSGISPSLRAEDLRISDWDKLAVTLFN